MKTEITDKFTAVNDAGESFTIVEITTFNRFQPLKGQEQWNRGSYCYELVDGTSLNEVEKGKVYKVWDKDKLLRRLT